MLNEKSICQKPKINVYCQIARLFPQLYKVILTLFPQEFFFSPFHNTRKACAFNNLFIFLIKFSPFRDYLPMKSPLSARATFFLPFFRSCCRKMISLYLLLRIELLLIAREFLDLIQTVSIKFFLKRKIRFTPTVLRKVLFSFNFSSIHWLSVLGKKKGGSDERWKNFAFEAFIRDKEQKAFLFMSLCDTHMRFKMWKRHRQSGYLYFNENKLAWREKSYFE